MKCPSFVFATALAASLSFAGNLRADYALETSYLLEGPGAGADSVPLTVTAPSTDWTAAANDSWLHSSASGSGSGSVAFTFDANPGPTRTGSLTVAGQTLTVTQAGSTYVAANEPNGTPILPGSQASSPVAMARDADGNIYFPAAGVIKKWTAATGVINTVVTFGPPSTGFGGLVPSSGQISGLAVDSSGNLYFTQAYQGLVMKWTASTQTLSTLVSTGLSYPTSIAVDGAGNLYFLNYGSNSLLKWTAATQTVGALVSGNGGTAWGGVVVDSAGNVYFTDDNHKVLKKWTAATQTASTIANTSGMIYGLAVDGSGNIYMGDVYDNTIKVWTASTQTLSTVVSNNVSHPVMGAVDGLGNLYFMDGHSEIKEWNATSQAVTILASAGVSSLNGFAVDGAGDIYISDGGALAIKKLSSATQWADLVVTSDLTEPTAVAVDASGNLYIVDAGDKTVKMWTAAAQTLSTLVSGLSSPNAVAVDSAGNVYFTDSGNNTAKKWTAATQVVSTLVSTGLSKPVGIAVDAAGNVFVVDGGNNTIVKWTAATQTTSVLISTGLLYPAGAVTDAAGNLYIADAGHGAIKKWVASTQAVTTVFSLTGDPADPFATHNLYALGLDASGNLYYAERGARGPVTINGVTSNVILSLGTTLNEVPRAFVDTTLKSEFFIAGSDTLPAVLPSTLSFTATSDQPWLTIDSVTNGVVHFSFQENRDVNRIAHISLLGQSVTIAQGGVPISVVAGSNTLQNGTGGLDFGPVYLGTSAAKNLTVYSLVTGSNPTLGTFTIDGTNAADFTISSLLVPLGSGSSNNSTPALTGGLPVVLYPVITSFNVSFNPKGVGARTATLHIPVTATLPAPVGTQSFVFDIPLQGMGSLAATNAASSVSGSWATLNGVANPNGQPSTAYFEYGAGTSYGSSTAALNVGSGNSGTPVSFNVSNLAPGTTYHYRLVINSDGMLYYGADQTFTTAAKNSPAWHSAQVTALTNPNLNNMAEGFRTGVAHSSWNLYFYKGTDSNIWCVSWNGAQWVQQQLTTGGDVSDWLAYGTSYNLCCYVTRQADVACVYYDGSKWVTAALIGHAIPLSGISGPISPGPGMGSAAGDIVIDQSWNIIYFRDANGSLVAVQWNGVNWSSTGLGGATNVKGSVAVDQVSHLIYYQGTDNQLWCYQWTGKIWKQVKLSTTANVGGSVAADRNGLMAYYRSSVDNSAWTVYWNGKIWAQLQLNAQASMSSSATSSSGIAPYTQQYDTLYLDNNGQCQALYWSGAAWVHTLLGDGGSNLTSGLSLQPTMHWAFARRSDGNVVVFYYQ